MRVLLFTGDIRAGIRSELFYGVSTHRLNKISSINKHIINNIALHRTVCSTNISYELFNTGFYEMKRNILYQAVFLMALFIVCFWGTLAVIVNTWIVNDDYSYGFLIPIISAYFIWENRKKYKEIPVSQDFRALPFLILFLL